MSDTDTTPSLPPNDQLVLVSGKSGTGKSSALRNIRNQERWMYLNAEAGKRLPFKNSFQQFVITDPYQVYEGFDHAATNIDKYDGIALDSITFLMDMFESQYIVGSSNTMAGWASYAQYFKTLMQSKVPAFRKPVVIIGHTLDVFNEEAGRMDVSVPIKGALKNQGVEAYFSTVVSPKKQTLRELEPYKSDLLHIDEDDEILGYKHVLQTRLTKGTIGDRIRSPMGMFTRNESFIDSDVQLLLDRLTQFYA